MQHGCSVCRRRLTSAEDAVQHLLQLPDGDGLVLPARPPPQEENTPVSFRVHNKRCSGERATGLKACRLQPYVTRQLVKEPPQALLLVRLLLGEAGGGRLRANTRRQHQQGPRPLPSQGGGLTSGRSASTLLPISLWRGGEGGGGGREADMRGGGAPRASEAAHLTLTQLRPSSRRTS